MLLAAIVIFLVVAFVVYKAFGPWDEGWIVKDDDEYVITSLFEYRKGERR